MLVLLGLILLILVGASLPWILLLSWQVGTLLANWNQAIFHISLSTLYVLQLLMAVIATATIIYFSVRWVDQHQRDIFK